MIPFVGVQVCCPSVRPMCLDLNGALSPKAPTRPNKAREASQVRSYIYSEEVRQSVLFRAYYYAE